MAFVEFRFTAGMLTYWRKLEVADTAPPTFPGLQATPFTKVAVRPLPDASVALVPEPSSNFQYPTSVCERTCVGASIAKTNKIMQTRYLEEPAEAERDIPTS